MQHFVADNKETVGSPILILGLVNFQVNKRTFFSDPHLENLLGFLEVKAMEVHGPLEMIPRDANV